MTDTINNTLSDGTTLDWSHSQGDYGQLCEAVLAWAQINGVPNGAAALAAFLADPPPYTDLASYQADPTFSFAA